MLRPHPRGFVLELLRESQEIERLEFGVDRDDCVQIRVLFGPADRSRFVHPGHGRDAHPGSAVERSDRVLQILEPVAQIGAESKVSARRSHRSTRTPTRSQSARTGGCILRTSTIAA